MQFLPNSGGSVQSTERILNCFLTTLIPWQLSLFTNTICDSSLSDIRFIFIPLGHL
jgi:hypothetical protein